MKETLPSEIIRARPATRHRLRLSPLLLLAAIILSACAAINPGSASWHDIDPPQLGATNSFAVVKTVRGVDIYTQQTLPTRPWLYYGFITAGGHADEAESAAIRMARSKHAEILILQPKILQRPNAVVGLGYAVGQYVPIP